MDDHRKPDGHDIDWNSYRKAQIANGEYCYRCGKSIMFGGNGYSETCGDCKTMDNDKDEVTHDNSIRCPKCRHQWPAIGDDDYGHYREDEHTVNCPECQHEFEIVTLVSYSFKSPELLEDPETEKKDATAGAKDSVEKVPEDGAEGPGHSPGA